LGIFGGDVPLFAAALECSHCPGFSRALKNKEDPAIPNLARAVQIKRRSTTTQRPPIRPIDGFER